MGCAQRGNSTHQDRVPQSQQVTLVASIYFNFKILADITYQIKLLLQATSTPMRGPECSTHAQRDWPHTTLEPVNVSVSHTYVLSIDVYDADATRITARLGSVPELATEWSAKLAAQLPAVVPAQSTHWPTQQAADRTAHLKS